MYFCIEMNNLNKSMKGIIYVFFEFIAPNMDEIPAKCNENMARSTDPPLCACAPAKGG
jgi:hypothetical protein